VRHLVTDLRNRQVLSDKSQNAFNFGGWSPPKKTKLKTLSPDRALTEVREELVALFVGFACC